jgi:hypothetical protein
MKNLIVCPQRYTSRSLTSPIGSFEMTALFVAL